MADIYSNILRKTDPFVLDATIENLENLSLNSNSNFPLPLGSNPGGKSDEEPPFLETPFNQLDDQTKTKYRSPWKPVDTGGANSSETEILELEQSANEVWDAYRQLYYGHDAVGSVYVRRKGTDVSGGRTGTPSKAKKGGALEALFGIQKKCFATGDNGDEIARWDSVHTITIEVPNFEEGTCEYKIKSAVWCRYKPEDVGDAPRTEASKTEAPKKAAASPQKKKSKSPTTKKENSKSGAKLNLARLEIFDKAANSWDNHHGKNKKTNDAVDPIKVKVTPLPEGTPLPPIPAVVTSSAVYTKDTTKVCKLLQYGGTKKLKAIPVASHIQNIGTLLEKIETDFRSKLERVDAPKCVEVLQGMYRPSLSPGLKLPNGNTGLISKRGGHATGMGVGKGMIGEIALKAKSKGLGNASGEASSGNCNPPTNKAMEGILASEKKKLKDLCETSPAKAPATWNVGLKKSSAKVSPTTVGRESKSMSSIGQTSPTKAPATWNVGLKKSSAKVSPTTAGSESKMSTPPSTPPGASSLKRPNLRKAISVRTLDSPTPSATPEFLNFRNKLTAAGSNKTKPKTRKSTGPPSESALDPPSSSATPEFMNFRNKLKPTAAK